jgi:holo-[acyl-carrier protein] synthase
MIYSIGVDIVDVGRIGRVYGMYTDKFLMRVFSPDEISSLDVLSEDGAEEIAGRFAAKEAVMKALGHFFDSGVFLRDIEIMNRNGDRAAVRLPDGVADKLRGRRVLISISCQPNIALALAIIADEE